MSYVDKLWTFQDAVEQTLDRFDVPTDERSLRQLKLCVKEVNRDLCEWHDWQFYMTTHIFRTVAPIDETVSYDASTRQATIDSGTWPSWALYGFLVINGTSPQVTAVNDAGTILTLDETAPTSNLATGTAARIARDSFELPTNSRKNFDLLNIQDQSSPWIVNYAPEGFVQFIDRAWWWRYTQTNAGLPLPYFDAPTYWTVGRDTRYDSGYSIRFAHIPNTAYPYSFSYFRGPRELRYYKEKAIVDVSSNVVTFDSDFDLRDDMDGSIVRISANGDEPTSIWGSPIHDIEDNPFLYQRVLTNIDTGANTAELEGGGDDVTAACAVVSDPLDIDYEVMTTMFTAAVDKLFASRQRRDSYAQYEMEFRRQVGLAKEYDENFRRTRGMNVFGAF